MSFSTSKPVPCLIPPVVGEDASLSQVSKVTMMNRQATPPLQVKGKEKCKLQERSSRREMLHLTAASVGLLSLQFPASAEAASVGEMIMQTLQQKFGLFKPKDESEKVENSAKEANPEPKNDKVENDAKEKKLTSSGQEAVVPGIIKS